MYLLVDNGLDTNYALAIPAKAFTLRELRELVSRTEITSLQWHVCNAPCDELAGSTSQRHAQPMSITSWPSRQLSLVLFYYCVVALCLSETCRLTVLTAKSTNNSQISGTFQRVPLRCAPSYWTELRVANIAEHQTHVKRACDVILIDFSKFKLAYPQVKVLLTSAAVRTETNGPRGQVQSIHDVCHVARRKLAIPVDTQTILWYYHWLITYWNEQFF